MNRISALELTSTTESTHITVTPRAVKRNQQLHSLLLKGAISALYYYGFALLIAQQYGGNCCYRLHQNCIYKLKCLGTHKT